MGHANTLNRLAEVPYAIFRSGAMRPSEDAYEGPMPAGFARDSSAPQAPARAARLPR
jgi:hypothetical protein